MTETQVNRSGVKNKIQVTNSAQEKAGPVRRAKYAESQRSPSEYLCSPSHNEAAGRRFM